MAFCYEKRGNKASTIRSKVSAVAHYHKMAGVTDFPAQHFLVRAVARGIERRQGAAGGNVRPERRALRWPQIQAARTCGLWAAMPGGMVTWYGLAMSFFLLARASELWAYDTSGEVHPHYCLTRADLTFMRDGRRLAWGQRAAADAVIIRFRGSKGDQLRRGAAIVRYGTCLRLLLELLELQPELPAEAPLTAVASPGGTWRAVTRKTATAALRGMLSACGVEDAQLFALHSGRIGAATRMAAAGLPDSAIMAAGRWKSASFMVYVRASVAESGAVSQVLES
jgi:hypothetical protein